MGRAHGRNSTEIGYLYRKRELNNVSGKRFRERKSSIEGLIKRKPNIPKTELLTGQASLGALFEEEDYQALPSPRQPSPGDYKYFRGGFTIQKYGSKDGGRLDGVQVEAPGELRVDGGRVVRDKFTL